jgi:hypothetical protein
LLEFRRVSLEGLPRLWSFSEAEFPLGTEFQHLT